MPLSSQVCYQFLGDAIDGGRTGVGLLCAPAR